MTDCEDRARRARLPRLALALLGCAAWAEPLLAQEAQDPQSRVLQMLGLGGKSKDEAASPAAPAAPPAPGGPAAITSPPGDEQPSVVGRMLEMAVGRGGTRADPKSKGLANCPDVVVDGGAAELRSPAGADAASVRYQFSIADVARECALNGDAITVRVGVQGAAVLGPAGQSGSYSGDLRIALRRKSDARLFGEKTHRVSATIPAGAARGEFIVLVEDLSAPFISAKAADDYEVMVGFQGGGESAPKPSRRGRGG
ncbi:MAG TPA: hypothetical protein VK446_00210 [Methylocystis sp.]|nr:hypothetical protein [Methylocystis sp.]